MCAAVCRLWRKACSAQCSCEQARTTCVPRTGAATTPGPKVHCNHTQHPCFLHLLTNLHGVYYMNVQRARTPP